MKKRLELLSEEQWGILGPLFPEPKRRKDGRGRPWATNRECLEGILWVLRTGARWRDMPAQYPDGSTCWRRLRSWEEQGVWQRAWRKLLSMLDQRRLLDWEEAFLDATFVTAKKGAPQSEKPSRERYEVHGGGRRQRHTCRSVTCVRATGRVPVGRKHARGGEGSASRARTAALPSQTSYCRPRLRFRRPAQAISSAWNGVDRPLP